MLLLNGLRGQVHSLAFSPDGATLALVAGHSSRIHLCDLTREQKVSHVEHTHPVRSVVFAPQSPPTLAWCDNTGNVLVWDMTRDWSRPLDRVVPGQYLPVRLGFSPDGRTLAATGAAVSTEDLPYPYRPRVGATLWQWRQGPGLSEPISSTQAFFALAFSPDGQQLALAGLSQTVYLRDLGRRCHTDALSHGRKVHHLAFCCDGRILISASPDGLVRRWDIESGKRRDNLRGVGKGLTALSPSPDGRLLATASSEGRVKLWDVESGRLLQAHDWGIGAVSSLAFAPDGLRAAAGGKDAALVWDIDL